MRLRLFREAGRFIFGERGDHAMTRDECREYLPENWLPILEADPMLWEIF